MSNSDQELDSDDNNNIIDTIVNTIVNTTTIDSNTNSNTLDNNENTIDNTEDKNNNNTIDSNTNTNLTKFPAAKIRKLANLILKNNKTTISKISKDSLFLINKSVEIFLVHLMTKVNKIERTNKNSINFKNFEDLIKNDFSYFFLNGCIVNKDEKSSNNRKRKNESSAGDIKISDIFKKKVS